MPSIIDTINIIRSAKDNVYAVWDQSDTVQIFQYHGYKKECEGDFF